jgi:8-oxo-dGTP pyrophosphatase MutT (NUDIX family)
MKTRYKVRGLVLDQKGRVYAMRANARHVLQLPGGSRKPSEDPIAALKREIREETGFKVRVLMELGTQTVMRCGVQEITTFYMVQIKGRARGRKLTKTERQRGLRVKRYPSVYALHTALNVRLRRYQRSAVQRDYLLVTTALEQI